jgi:peroxiredoxin
MARIPDSWKARLWRYGSWGVLLVTLVYAYRSVSPNIDLSQRYDPAPDFELRDMNGNVFRLSDQRGEVVVLNFWATWCPPCRAEIPGFVRLQREFAGDGVRFVGISLDEEGFTVVRPFASKHGLNYAQVVDRGEVAHRYGGISSVPTTFLIDREGRIRYVHSGLLLRRALGSALRELVNETIDITASDVR